MNNVLEELKDKIELIVKKIKTDKNFAKKFKDNPIKAAESVLGIDLPDEQLEKIVDGVKAKIKLDNAGDVLDKLKGLIK